MTDELIPAIHSHMPRKGNAVSRWVGRCLLRVLGWRVSGEFPVNRKVVVAVAPHTSNWDFVTAMAAVLASGLRVNFLMKKEAFVWPFSGLFKWFGGIPIDRSATENVVDQIVGHYSHQEHLWLAIAPEGTRQKVEHWKTGFLRVARQADIPVLVAAWNYPTREFVIDRLWYPSDDTEADIRQIKEYVNAKFKGRYPDQQ